jgi:ubiquitin-like 1-activating enzyme E1 B
VYAKELLFSKLFGDASVQSDLDEEDAVEAGAFRRNDGESGVDFAKRVFAYVFGAKIESLLLKDDMWKNRAKPTPLASTDVGLDGEFTESDSSAASARRAHRLMDPHAVWSQTECAKVFVSATARLIERARPITFDKDDDDAVEFVTAVSNLRSANYGIPPQSVFDAKGMAGNIIHAVATTNAIVSGLIVIEALKILHKRMDETRYTFVLEHASNGRLLQPVAKDEPNPKCPVCGNARVELVCDTTKFTKRDLVNRVLKDKLSVNEPTVQFGENLLHETGEDLDEEEVAHYASFDARALDKLPGGGVANGSILLIEDYSQDFKFELMVTHRADWDEEKEPDGFVVRGEDVKARAIDDVADAGTEGVATDADELFIVDDDVEITDARVKRARDDDPLGESGASAPKASKRDTNASS